MIEQYIPSRPLSLYIHFPFCRKRCDYCAFYSTLFDSEIVDKYYHVLKLELETLVEELKRPFYTIYFGGGNPILIGRNRIKELLNISSRYGKSTETTIEINPEDISEEIFSLYPMVNRISTGIQSIKDQSLLFLGRNARRKDNLKALEILSRSPFVWNADIITAIPNTAVEDTLYDITEVLKYNPHHVSFYCLTFEEGTPLIKKAMPLGEEEERNQLVSGWRLLKNSGYTHYEVSAFSLSGYECKHNLVYWNLGQYIALGASGESFLGYTKGVSMRNRETIEEFISSPQFVCETMNEKETEEAYLITKLRTLYGIDKKEYLNRFSYSFDEKYSQSINELNREWYINTPDSFFLTEEGLLLLNQVVLTLSMAI